MLIILGPYTERYRLSAYTSLFQLVTQGHLAEIEYPGPTVQLLPFECDKNLLFLFFLFHENSSHVTYSYINLFSP